MLKVIKGIQKKGYITEIDEDEIVQYECEEGIDYCSIEEIIKDVTFTGVIKDGLFEISM